MNDVVLRLGLSRPGDDLRLNNAIETYARWRAYLCDTEERLPDTAAPDIMVKTGFRHCGAVDKTLIFQDRRWAAAFLWIWRAERRRPFGQLQTD